MDRKGRRVFCAKFDRKPKWGRRHNITTPISATEDTTWAYDDVHLASRFNSGDEKYFNDEDNATYDEGSFEDDYY